MKVKFKSTKRMARYNGVVTFFDGDVKDVDDKLAKYLLESYPQNFAKAKKPSDNKAVTPENNK